MQLTRREREGFHISGPATIQVVKNHDGKLRFNVIAAPDVKITRVKLLEPVEVENKPAPEECC